MTHDPTDAALGILLGLAAGDRNGGPTRMAVLLAESLAERGAVELEDVGARYLAWWREGAFDTGPVAAGVFGLVDAGASFEAAAQQVHRARREQTAGCNPAHRSAPLAMLAGPSASELADLAVREARLTHAHPLAGDAAAAVVAVGHHLVAGAGWEAAVGAAGAGRLPETRAALSLSGRASLNRSGFAPSVLAAAVHFVHVNDTFVAALEASLRFAGAANYCPVLVGSLGGARWGARSIEDGLLRHCEILPRVREVGERLAGWWDG